MSKSRGTGISPDYYLDLGIDAEWLRYYIAAKLNDKVEDIDFNPDDFVARVNSDLIGKYVNIASRAARFVAQPFRRPRSRRRQSFEAASHAIALDRRSPKTIADALSTIANSARRCARSWSSPTRSTSISTTAKPWELAKDPAKREAASHEVCSDCIVGIFGS